MRQRVAFLTALVFCSAMVTTPSSAYSLPERQEAHDLPPVITDGLTAYKEKGAEEAVKVWIKDSPLDGSKDALSQSNVLRQVEDYYGKYDGYEVVEVKPLGPRTKIIYMVIDYEKGPLFGRFTVYKAGQTWVLTNFLFNTNIEKVLPDSLH